MPSWARPLHHLAAALTLATAAPLVVSCSVPTSWAGWLTPETSHQRSPRLAPLPKGVTDPLRKATVDNTLRFVRSEFTGPPIIVDDPDGVKTSSMFFDTSVTAIIAADDDASTLRAASLGIAMYAPMMVDHGDNHEAILRELDRLDASTVVLVGETTFAPMRGTRTVVQDLGTPESLEWMASRKFHARPVRHPDTMVHAVATLPRGADSMLTPTWQDVAKAEGDPQKLPPFPAQSRRDAGQAPVIIATPDTPIVAVANAKAFGTSVRVLDEADPSQSLTSMRAVAGLEDGPLIALGTQFGTSEELSARIARGHERALVTETPSA